MTTSDFPAINASLNAASGLLILVGYSFIRRRAIVPHATCMIAAVCTSAAFLVCYITYHTLKAMHGEVVTRFPPHPFWRPAYLMILVSHTLLAIGVLPMIITTLILTAKRRWLAHRRVARPTFFIWLYVSVTGVIVYWMLYRLAPILRG